MNYVEQILSFTPVKSESLKHLEPQNEGVESAFCNDNTSSLYTSYILFLLRYYYLFR